MTWYQSVYAAFDDGRIFRMDYPTTNWVPQPWTGLAHPWGTRPITSIDDDFSENFPTNTLYVTVGSFSDSSGSGQVFRSPDGGDTWQDITGDLPNLPAHAVAVYKGRGDLAVPYVGNDDGVYYGLRVGTTYHWTRLEPGLPHAQVVDLQLQNYAGTSVLAAATHGRGAWTTQLGGLPTVNLVCAASGPISGGNVVTITGQGFIGTTSVSFGSEQTTDFTVISDTELTVTVPRQITNTVDITVTNETGPSATSSLDQYTYVMMPIRTLSRYSPSCLPRGADSSDAVDLGFTINFFGQSYSSLYISNDGLVSFGSLFGDDTPYHLSDVAVPIIAPFWADVDTTVASVVSYGPGILDNGALAFAVNWINVGYDLGHDDLTNSFQLVLISRPDVGAGAFDIEFNYSHLRWEAGDSSGGSGGLGGISAYAGYSDGTGIPGNSYELYGSGINGYFLDSHTTGLIYHDYSGTQGRYVYNISGGSSPLAPPDSRQRFPAGRSGKLRRDVPRGGTGGGFVESDLAGATAVVLDDTRETSIQTSTPGRTAVKTPHPPAVTHMLGIPSDGLSPVVLPDRFAWAVGSGFIEAERRKESREARTAWDFGLLDQPSSNLSAVSADTCSRDIHQRERARGVRMASEFPPGEATVFAGPKGFPVASTGSALAIACRETVDRFFTGVLAVDPLRKADLFDPRTMP